MLIRDRIKKFARIPADKLRPNPRNWRTHPKHQREALSAVLAEIGFADCVLVRETDAGYELIDGHLRLDLMKDHKVPALILDVTREEADKILLTLDPLAGMAGVDKDALSDLAASVETGSSAIQSLIDSLKKDAGIKDNGTEANDPEPQIDKAEELRVKWGVERGQLWEIGRHRILCGDSSSQADVSRILGRDIPLLMVTDPPYGVDYDPSWRAKAGINKNQNKMGKVENDDNADWSSTWALFPGDVAYVYHAAVMSSVVQHSLEKNKFKIRAQIIWAKDRMALSRGDYHWQHEPCWYAVREGKPGHRTNDRSQSTLWEITQTTLWEIPSRDDSGHGHSTQKPLECMARAIRNHDCTHVYEPFSGSGTTIIACENLNRVCLAIEINPAYVAVAIQRWVDATGGTPVNKNAALPVVRRGKKDVAKETSKTKVGKK